MGALSGGAARVSRASRSANPAWSPDGALLACPVQEGAEWFAALVSMGGEQTRRLAMPGKAAGRFHLSWSPDGRFLAYVVALDAENEVTVIRLIRIADGAVLDLTDGQSEDWSPTWRSGDDAVYFTSNRGGGRDLWRQPIGPGGEPVGAPEQLTVGADVLMASFSRDGRRLTYAKGARVGNVWSVPLLPDRPAGRTRTPGRLPPTAPSSRAWTCRSMEAGCTTAPIGRASRTCGPCLRKGVPSSS
jgi:TolB protein